MGQLSERQRIEITLIWALALLLLYLFVLAPFFTAQRDAAYAERAAAEAMLTRIDVYQQMLRADEQAEAKLRVRQARLTDALPEEGGQGEFIHTVEVLARRSGVTIEGIAPQPVKTAGEIVLQPIELKFRGNYFAVLSFLRAVQEGERCAKAASFALTAEGAELHGVLLLHIAAYAGGVQQ